MTTIDDEKLLKQCLETTIKCFDDTITRLHPTALFKLDTESRNLLVKNVKSFTLNRDEDEDMEQLEKRIEHNFKEYVPLLIEIFQNYVLNFLHEYNYDHKKKTI